MLKIIIFGGFGFVGSNMKAILKKNYNVTSFSRRNGCDMNYEEVIINHLDKHKPNIIINCASEVGSLGFIKRNPANIFRNNSRIYLNLYEAVRKSNKNIVIYNPISNCAVDHELKIQKEDLWLKGEVHESVLSGGMSKRFLYYLSKFYNQQYNILSKNFLIPNAYGPGDYLDPDKTHALNGIVLRFLLSTINNEKLFTVWGSGKPKREWIFVEDIANLFLKEIKNNKIKNYYPINFAQNKSYSILDIANIVKRILKSKIKISTDTNKVEGVPMKQMDNNKFKKYFKNYKFVNLEYGIKKTINYYKKKINEDKFFFNNN
jgi:GDP-L-fucose synthase